MISLYENMFQSMLSLLPERQKEMLYAIAKEGMSPVVTSNKQFNDGSEIKYQC